MASDARRGGADIGGLYGTWPFGRITIDPGIVTVKLFARERSFTPDQVTKIAPCYAESPGGICILYRGIRPPRGARRAGAALSYRPAFGRGSLACASIFRTFGAITFSSK